LALREAPTSWNAAGAMELTTMGLDNLSVNYLMTKAKVDHKTPAQIIGEMVQERIATV
jgi:hypothetical protein